MDEEVCRDILAVLKGVKESLKNMDSRGLSDWSNRLTHCAVIHGEETAIYIAMIAYSLSKTVDKEIIRTEHKKEWDNFMEKMSIDLTEAIFLLQNKEFKEFDKIIVKIMKEIYEFDRSFSKYVQEVLDFAKVQKGAKIYEHGLSLSSVAKMMGITKWELMPKVGESKVHEYAEPLTAKQRFEKAKKLLKKKE